MLHGVGGKGLRTDTGEDERGRGITRQSVRPGVRTVRTGNGDDWDVDLGEGVCRCTDRRSEPSPEVSLRWADSRRDQCDGFCNQVEVVWRRKVRRRGGGDVRPHGTQNV